MTVMPQRRRRRKTRICSISSSDRAGVQLDRKPNERVGSCAVWTFSKFGSLATNYWLSPPGLMNAYAGAKTILYPRLRLGKHKRTRALTY